MIYITGTRDIHLENTAVALGKFDDSASGTPDFDRENKTA